jgi:hypothetical protein
MSFLTLPEIGYHWTGEPTSSITRSAILTLTFVQPKGVLTTLRGESSLVSYYLAEQRVLTKFPGTYLASIANAFEAQ